MYFEWSEEKKELLKKNRNVSFEDVQTAIQEGLLLDVHQHPNQDKYPHQKRLIVQIHEYVFIIPCVPKEKDIWFLKTIIPSRKATKLYLHKENNYE